MPATTQSALQVDVIKQYGGLVTVQRRVKVKVPGKHFPQLSPAEQKVEYEGETTQLTFCSFPRVRNPLSATVLHGERHAWALSR